MGAEQTKTKERVIVEIADCEIKAGKKRIIASELIYKQRFTNNVLVLLKDGPNYQDMMDKIVLDKEHKIEYIWNNRYYCFVVTDITCKL